jgi:hypothetical protein
MIIDGPKLARKDRAPDGVLDAADGALHLPWIFRCRTETYPALDWTLGLTRLGGVNEMEERLFTAIGTDKREASAFLGMITGVVPMGSFFSSSHLIRLIGVKDFLRLARARSR